MLLITGTVVDVSSRHVDHGGGFDVTTVHLLTGRRVERIDLGKSFRGDVPAKADEVALEVSVRAYPRAGGTAGGYELTAWANQSENVAIKVPSAA